METLVIALVGAAFILSLIQFGRVRMSNDVKLIPNNTSVSTSSDWRQKWLRYLYNIPADQWEIESDRTFAEPEITAKKPTGKAYIFQGTNILIEIEQWIPKDPDSHAPLNYIRFSGNGEEFYLKLSARSQAEEFEKLNKFCHSIEWAVFGREETRKFESILT